MNCNQCNHCSSECLIKCPECNMPGRAVPPTTVLSLTDHSVNTEKIYYLCQSKECPVGYFDENQHVIYIDEVKVPIWYKTNSIDMTICYCRNITLKDIVKAVKELNGCDDKLTIINYLKKNKIVTNCLQKNPTGASCERLFNNAIQYAITLFNKKSQS